MRRGAEGALILWQVCHGTTRDGAGIIFKAQLMCIWHALRHAKNSLAARCPCRQPRLGVVCKRSGACDSCAAHEANSCRSLLLADACPRLAQSGYRVSSCCMPPRVYRSDRRRRRRESRAAGTVSSAPCCFSLLRASRPQPSDRNARA